jgi:hypothetical protein
MAKRVSRIYGGLPCVTSFELDEAALSGNTLKVKIFDSPSVEWAMFVLNNRNKTYGDMTDTNYNHDNKYDIVSGPVANDDIALLCQNIFKRFDRC